MKYYNPPYLDSKMKKKHFIAIRSYTKRREIKIKKPISFNGSYLRVFRRYICNLTSLAGIIHLISIEFIYSFLHPSSTIIPSSTSSIHLISKQIFISFLSFMFSSRQVCYYSPISKCYYNLSNKSLLPEEEIILISIDTSSFSLILNSSNLY